VIDGIVIYGPKESSKQTSVVSINIMDRDPSEVGEMLDREFNISVRCGLHCAPGAHKTVGTFPQGTIRISLGYFNTKEDVDYLNEALCMIAE